MESNEQFWINRPSKVLWFDMAGGCIYIPVSVTGSIREVAIGTLKCVCRGCEDVWIVSLPNPRSG